MKKSLFNLREKGSSITHFGTLLDTVYCFSRGRLFASPLKSRGGGAGATMAAPIVRNRRSIVVHTLY